MLSRLESVKPCGTVFFKGDACMIFRNLSPEELLTKAKDIAASERKIYSQVIDVLEEIERRKLYLARGYSSLFSFCTEFLKYSAGAAQRRIDSMRLIKNFPKPQKEEVKEKLESGSVNLTHLSQVARVVRALPESKTCHEKMKLISKVENTTIRECEQKLLEDEALLPPKKEQLRATGDGRFRLSINLDQEAKDLLEKLLSLTAHQNPFASKEIAVKAALKLAAQEAEKKKSASIKAQRSKITAATAVKSQGPKITAVATSLKNQKAKITAVAAVKRPSRMIPRAVKREIWQRDGGRCVFTDPESGRPCGSSFALEFDHVKAFSNGGPSTADNLRLYCRNHNKHRAVFERFAQTKES